MNFQEFGSARKETILLLHGGGLSWWNYREAAALLQSEYHIILPILNGHAGSDRPFTTIEAQASEIISWMDAHLGGSAALIGGLSLGGQVLLEMLSQRPDLCPCALVESAAVIPSKLTGMLIAPAFGSSYGLIKSRSFAKMQFRSLHIQPALFEDALKDAFSGVSAAVHVYYGSRETGVIRRSAELLGETLPSCRLHLLEGFSHGEFSLNHADAYADAVRQIIGR